MSALKRLFTNLSQDLAGERLVARIAICVTLAAMCILPGIVTILAMCCGLDDLEKRLTHGRN